MDFLLSFLLGLIIWGYLIYLAFRKVRSKPKIVDRTSGSKTTNPVDINRAKILYIDAEGNSTTRYIRIHSISDAGADTLIHAFCELRRDHRSFYASRMEEMINVETGELIENPPKYFRELRRKNKAG